MHIFKHKITADHKHCKTPTEGSMFALAFDS